MTALQQPRRRCRQQRRSNPSVVCQQSATHCLSAGSRKADLNFKVNETRNFVTSILVRRHFTVSSSKDSCESVPRFETHMQQNEKENTCIRLISCSFYIEYVRESSRRHCGFVNVSSMSRPDVEPFLVPLKFSNF